jgi:hypothetical protein
MPAEGQPTDSRGGAPGNEPAYPRAGAPAHETDPIPAPEPSPLAVPHKQRARGRFGSAQERYPSAQWPRVAV